MNLVFLIYNLIYVSLFIFAINVFFFMLLLTYVSEPIALSYHIFLCFFLMHLNYIIRKTLKYFRII